jgi:hypothetical protein
MPPRSCLPTLCLHPPFYSILGPIMPYLTAQCRRRGPDVYAAMALQTCQDTMRSRRYGKRGKHQWWFRYRVNRMCALAIDRRSKRWLTAAANGDVSHSQGKKNWVPPCRGRNARDVMTPRVSANSTWSTNDCHDICVIQACCWVCVV